MDMSPLPSVMSPLTTAAPEEEEEEGGPGMVRVSKRTGSDLDVECEIKYNCIINNTV